MKRIRAFSLLFSLLLCAAPFLSACRGTAYSDGHSCASLMENALKEIPVEQGYEAFGEEHLRYFFENTQLPDDSSLLYSALSEDINEVGILHAPDERSAKEVTALAEAYLSTLLADRSAFIASYAPEELPKLERAEARTYGRYTVYAILNDGDRARFFEAVERQLKKS